MTGSLSLSAGVVPWSCTRSKWSPVKGPVYNGQIDRAPNPIVVMEISAGELLLGGS